MSDELSFHNAAIVIDGWQRDDTYEGVYPSGARVKDAYFSPKEPEEICIKSDWRYLFKLSRNRFPWQFWCEIIAYRFGSVIGIKVPPAHIGLSETYKQGEDTYAALIEWFYDDKVKGYVSGGQFMVDLIENFDRDRGEEHNLKTVMEIIGGKTVEQHWAGVLTFDSLIGNLDRHQDNWGFIVKRVEEGNKLNIEIDNSPAFDNGTALGYEILEENLGKFSNDSYLERYLTDRRAKHHMKWSLDETNALTFYEFMRKFGVEFPESKPIMAKYLDFTYEQVEEVLAPLVEAVDDPVYKLTQRRLDFILKLIFGRKRLLEEALEL